MKTSQFVLNLIFIFSSSVYCLDKRIKDIALIKLKDRTSVKNDWFENTELNLHLKPSTEWFLSQYR